MTRFAPAAVTKYPLYVALAALAAGLIGAGCATRRARRVPYTPPPAVEKYVRGVQAYKAGRTDEAVSSLEQATQENPNLTMARTMLGDIYADRGSYDKAAEQYEAVTRLDPYTGKNHFKLGLVYQLLVRFQEAVTSYLQALKLDPRDWESNMNLGLIYLAQGEKDEAVSYLSRATLLNPGSAAAFGNLGVALDAQKRYRDAETAYRRSVELDADDAAALSNLGANLLAQRKPREAVAVLGILVKRSPSPAAHKRYGDALMLANRAGDARAQYESALALEPRYYPAMNGLASTLIAQYKEGLQLDDAARDRALSLWRQSLAIKPQQPQVKGLVAQWEKG